MSYAWYECMTWDIGTEKELLGELHGMAFWAVDQTERKNDLSSTYSQRSNSYVYRGSARIFQVIYFSSGNMATLF